MGAIQACGCNPGGMPATRAVTWDKFRHHRALESTLFGWHEHEGAQGGVLDKAVHALELFDLVILVDGLPVGSTNDSCQNDDRYQSY